MKLPAAILILALNWSIGAWSGPIDKVTLAMAEPSRDFRQIDTFSPIRLRIQGKWNEDNHASLYLKSLRPSDIATLQEYNDFTVQNLTVDSAHHFTVEVSFRYGADAQTNYVFGDIDQGGTGSSDVAIHAYAEKNSQQEDRRLLIKNFENIVNSPNFESVRAQVQMDDYRRVGVVEPILRVWLATTEMAEKDTQ